MSSYSVQQSECSAMTAAEQRQVSLGRSCILELYSILSEKSRSCLAYVSTRVTNWKLDELGLPL